MIDPFGAGAKGVRIPSLNLNDTFTHQQYDSFSVNTAGYSSTGKALLIF